MQMRSLYVLSGEIYVLLFYIAEDYSGILLASPCTEVKLSQILRRFPPTRHVGFCLLRQIVNIIFM